MTELCCLIRLIGVTQGSEFMQVSGVQFQGARSVCASCAHHPTLHRASPSVTIYVTLVTKSLFFKFGFYGGLNGAWEHLPGMPGGWAPLPVHAADAAPSHAA